ncbi:MAG: DUF4406 domain-containing protein [Candidatus Kapaibacteriota bacterium]
MVVYISGKITGLDIEIVKQLFQDAETKLIELGYEVINPLKLPNDHDKTWESYMKVCIAYLTKCDAIYMLDGWENSRGANLEYYLAYELKIKVLN